MAADSCLQERDPTDADNPYLKVQIESSDDLTNPEHVSDGEELQRCKTPIIVRFCNLFSHFMGDVSHMISQLDGYGDTNYTELPDNEFTYPTAGANFRIKKMQ